MEYRSTDSNDSDIVSAPLAKRIRGALLDLGGVLVFVVMVLLNKGGCQPQNCENPVGNAANEVIHGQGRERGARRGAIRATAVRSRQHNPVANWEKIEKGDTINLQEFPFNEIEGCNRRMSNNSTCLDFLELYLTNEVIELSH